MAISDIDPDTPTGQNLVLDGDNEIRGFKLDVRDTFPAMAAAPMQDADSTGDGGTEPVSNTTMSSWEARIAALEDLATSPDGTSIPVGGIILWRGTQFPPGFMPCDGTIYTYTDNNGDEQTITSPDMRGRMAMHPLGGSINSGQTAGTLFDGGVLSVPTSYDGAHSHSVATPSHTLQVSEIPSHNHTNPIVGFSAATSSVQNAAALGNQNALSATGLTGGGGGHTHPTTNTGEGGDHFHRSDVTPPVYGLYYLMYVAS